MKIANMSELKEGVNEVFVGNKKFFICKNGSAIKVYSSICPHQGAILSADFVCYDKAISTCKFKQSEVSKTSFYTECETHEVSKQTTNRDISLNAQYDKVKTEQNDKVKITQYDKRDFSLISFPQNDKDVDFSVASLSRNDKDCTEIYCKVHNWRFDCISGKAINVKNANLGEVAFKIDNVGNICIDSMNGTNFTESTHQMPSLRGVANAQAIHKNDNIDCHDFMLRTKSHNDDAPPCHSEGFSPKNPKKESMNCNKNPLDSSPTAQNDKVKKTQNDKNEKPRNDKVKTTQNDKYLDFSPFTKAQNNKDMPRNDNIKSHNNTKAFSIIPPPRNYAKSNYTKSTFHHCH